MLSRYSNAGLADCYFQPSIAATQTKTSATIHITAQIAANAIMRLNRGGERHEFLDRDAAFDVIAIDAPLVVLSRRNRIISAIGFRVPQRGESGAVTSQDGLQGSEAPLRIAGAATHACAHLADLLARQCSA
jgi:hypothetical protein